MIVKRANSMKGELTVPGDKSISHRGIMFGAIAEGTTELEGFLDGADCRSTISCFRQMGIEISQDHDRVQIHGKGLYGLRQPKDMLDAGNSGTTVRLISGILAGQPLYHTVDRRRLHTEASHEAHHDASVSHGRVHPLPGG